MIHPTSINVLLWFYCIIFRFLPCFVALGWVLKDVVKTTEKTQEWSKIDLKKLYLHSSLKAKLSLYL